jgi:hypothetical protein
MTGALLLEQFFRKKINVAGGFKAPKGHGG